MQMRVAVLPQRQQPLHRFEALACCLDVCLIAYELTNFLLLWSNNYIPHICMVYNRRCRSPLVQDEDVAVQ